MTTDAGAPIVWFRGELIDAARPVLSVMDQGVLIGDGVFETVRVVDGRALALDRHLARLARSVAATGLVAPDAVKVRQGVDAVLGAGLANPGRLRITVTAGPSALGVGGRRDEPTLFVIGTALAPHPHTARVAVVPWVRNDRSPLVGVKSTSYAENAAALAAARRAGAHEAIFANTAGELCEGASTNVFVVLDGELCTPPLESGCLAGVTRGLVVELTGATERPLPLASLFEADEAFLTSTTRGVQPIQRVDAREMPLCPGPLTQHAADALGSYFFA